MLCCKPYSKPPGCTAVYKLAVDSAKPVPFGLALLPRLKSFAVFTFWAEMTRLPSHSLV